MNRVSLHALSGQDKIIISLPKTPLSPKLVRIHLKLTEIVARHPVTRLIVHMMAGLDGQLPFPLQ